MKYGPLKPCSTATARSSTTMPKETSVRRPPPSSHCSLTNPIAVDWHDLTRDILNFLSTYLPSDPGAALDTVLHPVAPHEFGKPRRRRLVGVGHSFGGTIL